MEHTSMSMSDPVLVVDDTAAFRDMVVAILSVRGYRVATATNGREAISRLHAAAEPHTVLLDIVMPVLDGLATLRELRADPALSRAGHRVILMSTSARLAAPDAPVSVSKLPKPFTPRQLVAAVEAIQRS
jgi:CheY-like chemotaxis protein